MYCTSLLCGGRANHHIVAEETPSQADANLRVRTYDGGRLLSNNLLTESKQRLLRRMPGLRSLVSASLCRSAKEVACIDTTMSRSFKSNHPKFVFKERRA